MSKPLLFALLLLVCCSRTRVVADGAPVRADASAALAISAAAAADSAVAALASPDASTPRPLIELRTPGADAHRWSLEARGLPAISANGAQVLFVVESDPDQRGYPHDTFNVRRVSDDLDALQLVGFDGYALGSADDSALRPAIQQRAAALHALLAREAWTPMPVATAVAANAFALGDHRFTLNGERAMLTQKGVTVATFDTSTWRRPDILPDSMSSSTCVFTAELARVHIDAKARVIAVTVRQRVKDEEHTTGCTGPVDTHALHF